MHVDGQPQARRRGIWMTALMALIAAVALVQAPPAARAAERTADIRAKERSDPAAGEIIILNRRKTAPDKPEPTGTGGDGARAKSEAAPDPYAPSPPEARTVESPPERPARQSTAAESDAAPLPPPPLPSLNRQARPREWARTGDDRGAFAREQARRPPAAFREEQRDYRAQRWREAPPRTFADRRPWRACRRLARLCEDGFERACWSWQRRC